MALSSQTSLERIGTGRPGVQTGIHTQVIAEAAATRTLTAAEAGSTCCFDLAAGVVYTLPAPVEGMTFEFFSTVTITSNSAKIITNAATVFLLGEVFTYTTATASGAGFAFNGTTHVACTMNGTTTGGIIGTKITLKALDSTRWMISGLVVGSGIIATPAATS